MLALIVPTGYPVLVAIVVFAASVLLAQRWTAGRDYLALAAGIGGLALASFLTFIVYWLAPAAGPVWAIGLVVAAAGYLAVRRVWRAWRTFLPIALVTLGIFSTYLALVYLRSSPDQGFALVAQFMHGLTATPDNQLSGLVAERLAAGQSTHHVSQNWNGSDRPPLLAGFILLARAAFDADAGAKAAAFTASMVAQLLWVPALFAFLRSVGIARRATLLTVLFTAVVGGTIVNSIYTWPKMLSAALVLASAAVLMDAIRRPGTFGSRFVAAVVLFTFGMLSHGGAAFALPVVVVLGVIAYRRQTPGSILRWTGIAAVAGVALYLPWILYQRLADPPGDRLLKWHLAGVVDEDSRSFFDAVRDAYSSITPGEWLAGRIDNVLVAFNPDPLRVPWCWCDRVIDGRRQVEFFTSMGALGVALPLILVALIVVVVRLTRTHRLRPEDRTLLGVTALAIASMLFWCLLVFIPGTTVPHLGSQVWIMLLVSAPFAWLATRRPRIALVVFGLQAALSALLYLPIGSAINPLGAVIAVFGVTVTVIGARAFLRPRNRLSA